MAAEDLQESVAVVTWSNQHHDFASDFVRSSAKDPETQSVFLTAQLSTLPVLKSSSSSVGRP